MPPSYIFARLFEMKEKQANQRTHNNNNNTHVLVVRVTRSLTYICNIKDRVTIFIICAMHEVATINIDLQTIVDREDREERKTED